MKTSIATVSISGDFQEKLTAIARAGFDGIEIFENDFLAFDRSPAEVGRMVRDHGLKVTLFQPFRDFEGMPEPFRSRNFDRAERKFDLMAELGTNLMLICSNTSIVAPGQDILSYSVSPAQHDHFGLLRSVSHWKIAYRPVPVLVGCLHSGEDLVRCFPYGTVTDRMTAARLALAPPRRSLSLSRWSGWESACRYTRRLLWAPSEWRPSSPPGRMSDEPVWPSFARAYELHVVDPPRTLDAPTDSSAAHSRSASATPDMIKGRSLLLDLLQK